MRWRLEQAEEFRQEVEQYTDAERVVLADANQALLRYGPLPHRVHRLRSIGSANRAPATPSPGASIRRRTVGSELVIGRFTGRLADSLTGWAS